MHGTQSADEAVLEPQDEQPIMPVPVHGELSIAGRVYTSEEASDFGTYRTVVLAGTEDKIQILSFDLRRVRAVLIVSGTGPVYFGSESQCAAINAQTVRTTTGAGFVLPANVAIELRNKEPLWMIPDGTHSATVSILQEKMR